MAPSPQDLDHAELSRLTHEMSNSLAYVTTNLSVLAEEIEGSARLEGLVADALEGSERLGDLLRRLRQVGWEQAPVPIEPREARILVVDDEPAILAAVQRALRRHVVVTAGSVAEASSQLDDTVDVVLCDLVMPVRSGIDWFHEVVEHAPELAGRFVFMTGGGFNDETRTFLAETPHAVLHKPFDAKTLRWVVGTRLGAR